MNEGQGQGYQPYEVNEAVIRNAYIQLAKELDQVSKQIDEFPPSFSTKMSPEDVVDQISKIILAEYNKIAGSTDTAETKLRLLRPTTQYNKSNVVSFGMVTLGEYLVAVAPLVVSAQQPPSILLHQESLKVILMMMRANLERDEFNAAIANPEQNFRVASSGEQSYLEVIPDSFLDYFLKATDPDQKDTIVSNHRNLLLKLGRLQPLECTHSRRWSLASSLGSIFLYNPDLYKSEIDSEKFYNNSDCESKLDELCGEAEDLESMDDSSDFELFARIKPSSALAMWLFPHGMPTSPVDRYTMSAVTLFGTVSCTKTRYCPAGQSLMKLFSGTFPAHNITKTFITLFCENVTLESE